MSFVLGLFFLIVGAPVFFLYPLSIPNEGSQVPKDTNITIEKRARRLKTRQPVGCQSFRSVAWRNHIPLVIDNEGLSMNYGHIYEFGVYNGRSMKILRRWWPATTSQMWGFDSFEGIPDERNDVLVQTDWRAGKYKTSENLTDMARAIGNVTWIKGWYDQSLSPTLAADIGMRPAMYVDIDCDLYSSARSVLDWLFESQLIQVGTIIGYDDWWINPCSNGGSQFHPFDTGEGRAHAEMTRKWKVKFRCAAGSCYYGNQTEARCNSPHPIFIVDSYGGDTVPDTGFAMTDEQVTIFKTTNRNCIKWKHVPKLRVKKSGEARDGS